MYHLTSNAPKTGARAAFRCYIFAPTAGSGAGSASPGSSFAGGAALATCERTAGTVSIASAPPRFNFPPSQPVPCWTSHP
jgi:hypothetical protein